jgi:hypothetical protein
VRSDRRATTMVIAAASMARPASWPPIRRGSSGNADEVSVTPSSLLCLPPEPAACADGVTVGNSPLSPDGETVAPGIGAYVTGGNEGMVPPATGEWPDLLTDVWMLAEAADIEAPEAVIVKLIGAPFFAVVRTRSVTISSSAWLAGRMPILHVVLRATGQRV